MQQRSFNRTTRMGRRRVWGLKTFQKIKKHAAVKNSSRSFAEWRWKNEKCRRLDNYFSWQLSEEINKKQFFIVKSFGTLRKTILNFLIVIRMPWIIPNQSSTADWNSPEYHLACTYIRIIYRTFPAHRQRRVPRRNYVKL